jgi:hypothetical protein
MFMRAFPEMDPDDRAAWRALANGGCEWTDAEWQAFVLARLAPAW